MQGLCLSLNEDHMATRNDNNDQNKAEQNKAADEAARTARTVTDDAARVGEQTTRAGADVFRRSTETARDGLQQGLNTATQTFQRINDQFTQALGFNGPQAEELARRSSQNIQAVSQASSVLMKGAQEVSHGGSASPKSGCRRTWMVSAALPVCGRCRTSSRFRAIWYGTACSR